MQAGIMFFRIEICERTSYPLAGAAATDRVISTDVPFAAPRQISPGKMMWRMQEDAESDHHE
jgi:hypothetical protein